MGREGRGVINMLMSPAVEPTSSIATPWPGPRPVPLQKAGWVRRGRPGFIPSQPPALDCPGPRAPSGVLALFPGTVAAAVSLGLFVAVWAWGGEGVLWLGCCVFLSLLFLSLFLCVCVCLPVCLPACGSLCGLDLGGGRGGGWGGGGVGCLCVCSSLCGLGCEGCLWLGCCVFLSFLFLSLFLSLSLSLSLFSLSLSLSLSLCVCVCVCVCVPVCLPACGSLCGLDWGWGGGGVSVSVCLSQCLFCLPISVSVRCCVGLGGKGVLWLGSCVFLSLLFLCVCVCPTVCLYASVYLQKAGWVRRGRPGFIPAQPPPALDCPGPRAPSGVLALFPGTVAAAVSLGLFVAVWAWGGKGVLWLGCCVFLSLLFLSLFLCVCVCPSVFLPVVVFVG